MQKVKEAALQVLRHNLHGPYQDLPRTAGWGYPEPYTRDLMISSLGMLISGSEELVEVQRRILTSLAKNQSARGHICSLVHDPLDAGASDTTPLFLFGLALFRMVTGERDFLSDAAGKAFDWLDYQSPDDTGLIAHLPTSDWRDEQWVWGYGLYVNSLLYGCYKMYGMEERVQRLFALINRAGVREIEDGMRIHEGLGLIDKPYYAHWVYKIHFSNRFDLLGNSLAIIFGLANQKKARKIIEWVETTCDDMRESGGLACDLPPCLLPFILPKDEDWHPRYRLFNLPGEYHNGGIWPFIVGFYIAALISTGDYHPAQSKLTSLIERIRLARQHDVEYGFNEWLHATDCSPRGEDWQTWSAAMVLYAIECVEKQSLPFLAQFGGTF